jgi:hypothetical protein
MAQQPFTPAGVQQMQADLYLLSDADLQVEAALIRSDFRQWVADKFILDASQETYLANLQDEFVAIAAGQTGTAVTYRLGIIMVVPDEPQLASKLIRTTNVMQPVSSSDGTFGITGDLIFTIYYQ